MTEQDPLASALFVRDEGVEGFPGFDTLPTWTSCCRSIGEMSWRRYSA
jgi:hypothetical protein